MQRSPLGGRGFESFAEDPHLSGVLASQMILGCEGTGVISTVKHFICNVSYCGTQTLPLSIREIRVLLALKNMQAYPRFSLTRITKAQS